MIFLYLSLKRYKNKRFFQYGEDIQLHNVSVPIFQFGEDVQFLCKCSFLEIYNEQVFDLLDPGSTGLQIRENMKRGVFVDGIIEQSVLDATEAYQVVTTRGGGGGIFGNNDTCNNTSNSRMHFCFHDRHIANRPHDEGICVTT